MYPGGVSALLRGSLVFVFLYVTHREGGGGEQHRARWKGRELACLCPPGSFKPLEASSAVVTSEGLAVPSPISDWDAAGEGSEVPQCFWPPACSLSLDRAPDLGRSPQALGYYCFPSRVSGSTCEKFTHTHTHTHTHKHTYTEHTQHTQDRWM